jgi:hypothetical protein
VGKRTFRPSAPTRPAYPGLPEVERRSPSRLGLVTLGGLLAVGAACPRRDAPKAEQASPPPPPSDTKDASSPPLPPPPLQGVMAPQRIDEPKAKLTHRKSTK